jgi:hypothetical protein
VPPFVLYVAAALGSPVDVNTLSIPTVYVGPAEVPVRVPTRKPIVVIAEVVSAITTQPAPPVVEFIEKFDTDGVPDPTKASLLRPT